MATEGGCFIGAALSCVDILAFLYGSEYVRVSPELIRANAPRDVVLLSKGHAVPALYGVLAESGYFDPERLSHHLKADDDIYWHPNRSIPGIEFHSGSLGHLLSVGAGIALDMKMKQEENVVYVVLGDGELNEGSVWESALVAAGLRLDNLVVIIDRNNIQANAFTEDLVPLESIERKFESFGWGADTIDGHNFGDMEEAVLRLPFRSGSPSAIIAETVRGKGIPSIENKIEHWFGNFSRAEISEMERELVAGIRTSGSASDAAPSDGPPPDEAEWDGTEWDASGRE